MTFGHPHDENSSIALSSTKQATTPLAHPLEVPLPPPAPPLRAPQPEQMPPQQALLQPLKVQPPREPRPGELQRTAAEAIAASGCVFCPARHGHSLELQRKARLPTPLTLCVQGLAQVQQVNRLVERVRASWAYL